MEYRILVDAGDARESPPPPLPLTLLPFAADYANSANQSPSPPQRRRLADVSLNMWGDCRPGNYVRAVRRARRLRPARLALFAEVKAALESSGIEYALYGGSALAVHREGGRMIAHDSDVDLVTREANFARAALLGERMAADTGGRIVCDTRCGLSGRSWLPTSPAGPELPYDGRGCKRLKFCLTQSGCAAAGLDPDSADARDPSTVHVDLFTVSPHPLDPAGSLRVNWTVPGAYDSLAKRFPRDCLFPPAPCLFEGLRTFAPRRLQAYLTVEYGYLGRDAMYDPASGLYVQIPRDLAARMPAIARSRLLLGSRSKDEAGESDQTTD